MKKFLTLMTMVMMISLLAAGAFAQENPGPNDTKEPRQNYEDVPGDLGNGGIHRNGEDNQQQANGGNTGDTGPHSNANGDPDGEGPQVKPGSDGDKVFIDGNQEQQEPQGVQLIGPAPYSGDGVPDGSGWDHENFGAPNSGDGIPDGSGWDKLFIDEDGDGIADKQFDGQFSGVPKVNSDGANAIGTRTQDGILTETREIWGPGEPQTGIPTGPLDGAAAFGALTGIDNGVGTPAGTSVPTASQLRPGGSQ